MTTPIEEAQQAVLNAAADEKDLGIAVEQAIRALAAAKEAHIEALYTLNAMLLKSRRNRKQKEMP